MPNIRFPALMKYYIENQSDVSADGETVNELLQNVLAKYPALTLHLFDSSGNLRRHFSLFVNGIHIRELNGMETKIRAEDIILLVASAAGG